MAEFELFSYCGVLWAKWEKKAAAVKYVVTIKEKDEIVCSKEFFPDAYNLPVRIMDVGQGKNYEGELYIVTECLSASSCIPDNKELLRELLECLEREKKENLYYVPRTMEFPVYAKEAEYVFEQAAALWKMDSLQLDSSAGAVVVEEENAILIEGVCHDLPYIKKVSVCFVLTEDAAVDLQIIAFMDDEWVWAKLFPILEGHIFDRLPFKEVQVSLKQEACILEGILCFETGQAHMVDVAWRSQIDFENGEPAFSLKEVQPLHEGGWETVTVQEPGRETILLQPLELQIYRRYLKEQWEEQAAVLCEYQQAGYITSCFLSLPYQLDPANADGAGVKLKLLNAGAPAAGVKEMIAEAGGAELVSFLPDYLLQLVCPQIDLYEIAIEGWHLLNSSRTLSISLPDIDLIPSLISLQDVQMHLEIRCNTFLEEVKRYYKWMLLASVRLNNLCIQAEIEVTEYASWMMTLKPDASKDLLTAAGELFGFDAAAIFSELPKGLAELLKPGIQKLAVSFSPFEQKIEYIQFEVGQCADWNIFPGRICLCDWTAQIRLRCTRTNSDWKVSALIQGSVRLGDPAQGNVIQVVIPLQENVSGFSIRMKAGALSLPTVQGIFGLLGMEETARQLPDAIAAMGQPCMDDMEIGISWKEALQLQKVYVSFRTQEPLELIPDSFVLHSVSARIGYRSEDNKLWANVTGEVRICNVGIRVELSNQNEEGEWKLRVLSLCSIHIPGIGQMAEWLCPGEFLKYIPDTLMPFPDGLDLCRFGFDYNFTKGGISNLEFGIVNSGQWRILEGLLVLEHAYAEGKLHDIHTDQMSSAFLVQAIWKLGRNRILLELTAGSGAGSTDTILKGSLSREETEAVSLCEIQKEDVEPLEKLPLPSDFQIPFLESLEVSVNLTKKHYVVCGGIENLGSVGFAVIKSEKSPGENPEEEIVYDWQYAVAFQLKEDFSFGSLVPALAVLDNYLTIEQAGLVMASFAAESLSGTMEKVQEWKKLLPAEGFEGISLKKGLLLYGQISIAESPFRSILQLGDDFEPSLRITVFSYLDRIADQSTIQGSLNAFSILSLFHFQDIRFLYVPAQKNLFRLSGTITAAIGETEYAFAGTMQMDDAKGKFEVRTEHEIVRPLGIPGITIRQLMLAIECHFATEEHPQKELTAAVKGSVGFGMRDENGQEELILDACLLYDKQEFQIVEVSLAKPLSVDRLFAAVFSSIGWPEGMLDITFSGGILYYARQDCRISDRFYQKGFHLDTNISIYGFSFGVGVDVYEDGICVSGYARNPISLLFVRLTDATEETKGPSVYIRAYGGEKSFGLQAGIVLFGERFCSVPEIGYNLSKKVFCGTISYDGSIEWLHGSISFEWSERDGFCITDWPMQWLTDALDYAELIEKASRISGSACEAMVDLVWSETIFTRCSVEPEFGTAAEEGMLPLEITVTYEVMVKKKVIIKTALPAISIALPILEELSFQGLSDAIQKAVSQNAVKVVEQIFAEPEKLAEFITLIGITKYGSKAAASLICNGMREWMSGSKALSEAGSFAKAAAAQAGGGSGLAGTAASASMAAAESEKAGEIFASIAAFFATLFGIFSIGSSEYEDAEEKKEAAKREKEKADQELEQARKIVRDMLQIKQMTYGICPDKRTLSIQFQKVAPDNTGVVYYIEAYDDSGRKAFEKNIKDSEASGCDIPYEIVDGKQTGKLRVQLQAVYTDTSSKKPYRYEGDVFAKEIICYERFVIQAQYQEEKIIISWNPVTAAGGYALSLRTKEEEIKRYVSLQETGLTLDLLYETFLLESGSDLFLHVEVETKEPLDIQSLTEMIQIPEESDRLLALKERLKKERMDVLLPGRYIRRQFPDVEAGGMAAFLKEVYPDISVEMMADAIYLLYEDSGGKPEK